MDILFLIPSASNLIIYSIRITLSISNWLNFTHCCFFFQNLHKHAAVPLSNCLSMADKERIEHSIKTKRKEVSSISGSANRSSSAAEYCPYKHGQVIIAKAFLGETQQASEHSKWWAALYIVDILLRELFLRNLSFADGKLTKLRVFRQELTTQGLCFDHNWAQRISHVITLMK